MREAAAILTASSVGTTGGASLARVATSRHPGDTARVALNWAPLPFPHTPLISRSAILAHPLNMPTKTSTAKIASMMLDAQLADSTTWPTTLCVRTAWMGSTTPVHPVLLVLHPSVTASHVALDRYVHPAHWDISSMETPAHPVPQACPTAPIVQPLAYAQPVRKVITGLVALAHSAAPQWPTAHLALTAQPVHPARTLSTPMATCALLAVLWLSVSIVWSLQTV